MKKDGLRSEQYYGTIYLFKNDKLIRDKKFNRKYTRVECMKEYMNIAKVGTGDSYYIIIKLDI